jgi:hypothetical protein
MKTNRTRRFKATPAHRKKGVKKASTRHGPDSSPSHLEMFSEFIGMVNGPADLARNHTHYAHGGKKK